VLPAVAVFFGGVWLRSLRWRVLLRPALRTERMTVPHSSRLFEVLVVGFTVNNVLPARLGELARAYMLWHRERIEPGVTIATIILERVLDGLTLLVFAGLAALVVPFPTELQRAAWATAALFLIATVGLVAFLARPAPFVALGIRVFRLLPERFALLGERLVLAFVDGLAVLRDPRSLVTVLGLSLSAWLAEATMYFVIMLGFPFPARPEAALLGAAAANIGTMIPSSPGYVGTFDLPLQLVLTQVFGVSLPEATSYTLVLHAALVVPVVLLGAFFIWRDWRNADETTRGRGLLGGLQAMRTGGGQPAAVNGQPASGEPVGSGQQSAKR
jgi:glycosyltransferase 2 family protein